MTKKVKTFLIAAFFLAVGLLAVRPQTAKAANPTEATLTRNVTYSNYDITGDGKPDSILLQYTPYVDFGGDGTINIYINGSLVHSYSDEALLIENYKIITLKNGKPFLFMQPEGFNSWGKDGGVFQYRSGKLVKVIDFLKMFPVVNTGEVVKVSGNKITVQIDMLSSSFGALNVNFDYVYKNGTLKKSGTVGDIESFGTIDHSGNLKVKKRIVTYKSPRTNKKSFVAKIGSEIVPEKVYSGKYGNWTKVKYKNKYGWIKWNDAVPLYGNQLFSNVMYYG